MPENKEKTAVGIAVPATEKEDYRINNISENTEKIKCVIQKPGQISEVSCIDNTLEEFQSIVGGYIETLTLQGGLILVMNEEGKLKGLEPNIRFYDGYIVGTVLITVADNNGNFRSLTVQEIQTARAWLIKNTI